MTTSKIDPDLLKKYASTARQVEFIDAVHAKGSFVAAAAALNCTESVVRRAMHHLRDKASIQGDAPAFGWSHPVPETHYAKGVSNYYKATPATPESPAMPAGWVKAEIRQSAYNEMVRDAMTAFSEDLPLIVAPSEPKNYSTDIIPWIQIGDAHIGMLAHAPEVNDNFDVKIGEREICGAIGMLLDEMPATERVVLNDLGDFTHYTNFEAITSASGHRLDFDSRFPKMIKAYSRIMHFIVDKALTKAKHVDVIINQGNHSRENDIWMAVLLKQSYGHTGRVHVLDNDSVFIGYRMGNTLCMTHHSDKTKPARLPSVMTRDFRKDFGETEFHYIDIGHVHHSEVTMDHSGIVVESWNHLAASDKWAHEAGYRSSKSITVVLRSRTYGEIGRRVLPLKELRDRLYGAGKPHAVGSVAFVA